MSIAPSTAAQILGRCGHNAQQAVETRGHKLSRAISLSVQSMVGNDAQRFHGDVAASTVHSVQLIARWETHGKLKVTAVNHAVRAQCAIAV